MWKNLDKNRPESAHYSVMKLINPGSGMEALRAMFPNGEADDLNAVLFSTSGVHGTYNSIEEAEQFLVTGNAEEFFEEVTFLIVHPRLVALRYGVCEPKNADDIDFLKRLRDSSHKAFSTIGKDTQ